MSLITPAAAVVSLVALTGCPNREVSRVDPQQDLVEVKELPVNLNRKIDLLFVIDDSGSMEYNQANLNRNFGSFINVLQAIPDGMGGTSLPDVHIGVVSSDAGCGGGNGDNGDLQTTRHIVNNSTTPSTETTEACEMLNGAKFIQDDGLVGGTTNYTGSLVDAFTCIASVGIKGCGIEAHLESMKRALNNNVNNNGFLRDDAFLAVVILADEDDCSAGSPNLFASAEAPYGKFDSFRCFEYGVTCDEDARDPGAGVGVSVTHNNCVPNSEANSIVKPIDGYIDFLKGLKDDPRDVIVATIIGNPDPVSVSKQGASGNNPGWYQLDYSCSTPDPDNAGRNYTAVPGVRFDALRQQFPDRNFSTTICNPDLSDALVGIATLIGGVIGNPCLQNALADKNPDLDGVQFECSVSQSVDGGEPSTIAQCNSDTSPTNTPCWNILQDNNCPAGPANQLSVKLDWGGPPPSDTILSVQCATTDEG